MMIDARGGCRREEGNICEELDNIIAKSYHSNFGLISIILYLVKLCEL